MKQYRYDSFSSREATHTADLLLAPGKRTLTGHLGYAGAEQRASEAAEVGRDLAKDLVPIVIDPASARAASTAVKLHPAEIAASPDASVQRLFDAIGAHATDALSVDVLRGMLPRLGQIALDPGVTNTEWQTPARVRGALHRWQASSAELKPLMTASAAMKQTEKTAPFTKAMQAPVSTERFLIRLDTPAAKVDTGAAGTTMLDATRSTAPAPNLPTNSDTGSAADFCANLLATVHDPDSAALAAATLAVDENELEKSPDAAVEALFFAITAIALDPKAIPILRKMMARIGKFAIDTSISDAAWKTPTRLGDALHRYLADPAPLKALAITKPITKVGHGAAFSEELQGTMSTEGVLLHLEELRDVIGVAIDPLATSQTYRVDFGKASGQLEIEQIVKMGFHSVRVELQAPLKEDLATQVAYRFFMDLVAYNAAHLKSPPITIDLVINMRGTIDNPAFGLDRAEVDDNPIYTDKQRSYALELLGNTLAKLKPIPDHGLRKQALLDIQAQISAPSTKLTAELLGDVAMAASTTLGGSIDDYTSRLQSPRTMAAVGQAFGTDAASVVADLEAHVANVKPYLKLVELGNEPEAQWKTPGVKQAEKTTFQRNTEILDAALTAFDGAQSAAGAPIPVAPAASEWDPASEQDVLRQVYDDITAGTVVDVKTARGMIDGSNWGHAFKTFAALHAKTAPKRTPLAIHIYNHPLLAQALISEIATVASNLGIIFDISITELQIDGNTSAPKAGDTRQNQLADGVVDLGVSVMAAAAGNPNIAIVQVTAFSYQHVSNRPGQEFSLRGNQELTALIGDPPSAKP